MIYGLPTVRPGQRIGLLGGSFDPPHAGHIHISQAALRRFNLDQVWWLVSPGNPLKQRGPAPMQVRLAACRQMVRDPRIKVTDFEARIGTRYTARTLEFLFRLHPAVRCVWLMGADNLAGFHHWEDWQWIMENVPVGVIARPGDRISARTSPAARRFRRFRLPGSLSQVLPDAVPPAWCFINVPMVALSSTDIRERGDWRISADRRKSP